MTPSRAAGMTVLGAVAVFAVAINLRPAVVSLAPLLVDIRRSTGLSGTGAGLLTGLSVVCFGLFAPFAGRLAGRFGVERVLIGAVALLVPMIALRLIDSIWVLFGSVLICGAAIAVANVLVPAAIRSGPAGRAGPLMGVYVVALSGAAAVAAVLAVPLRDAFGGSWATSLAFWAVPAAVATMIALVAWRGRETRPAGTAVRRRLERLPVTWALPLFMAIQCAQFYGASAWLPTIFHEAGATETHAGALLATMQLVGVLTGLGIPILAGRSRRQSGFVVLATSLWAVGWIGTLIAPLGAPMLWMIAMGLGQGAGISLALMLIVVRSADTEASTSLSARTHRDGYLLGACGPLLIGVLHGATGEWRTPMLVMLLLLIPMTYFGWIAGRPSTVGTVVR